MVQKVRSSRSVMNATPPVSACLLSYKRPGNLAPIVAALRRYDFIREIIVWNNAPETTLEFEGSNLRVVPATRNVGCAGRYACAALARHPVVYVQDDDVIVENVEQLYRYYCSNPYRVTHGLSP